MVWNLSYYSDPTFKSHIWNQQASFFFHTYKFLPGNYMFKNKLTPAKYTNGSHVNELKHLLDESTRGESGEIRNALISKTLKIAVGHTIAWRDSDADCVEHLF